MVDGWLCQIIVIQCYTMLHNIIAFMHPPRTPWQLPNMVRTCVFLSSRARGYRPRKCRCNPKWDDTGKNVGTHTLYIYILYAFDFLWFLNKGLDHTSICSIKNTFGPFINTYIKRTISCRWSGCICSAHITGAILQDHSAKPLVAAEPRMGRNWCVGCDQQISTHDIED